MLSGDATPIDLHSSLTLRWEWLAGFLTPELLRLDDPSAECSR